jgi:hypothetical protein
MQYAPIEKGNQRRRIEHKHTRATVNVVINESR